MARGSDKGTLMQQGGLKSGRQKHHERDCYPHAALKSLAQPVILLKSSMKIDFIAINPEWKLVILVKLTYSKTLRKTMGGNTRGLKKKLVKLK